MVDAVLFLLGLLGAVSTWRFLTCAAVGVVLGIVVWQFELQGPGKIVAVLLVVTGAVLGIAWQLWHERRNKHRDKT